MALEAKATQTLVGVTIVTPDGDAREIAAEIGKTLMEAAVDNGVAGIDATCGGSCACATCHVFVDPDWYPLVGPPSAMEDGTLYFGAPRRATSRLSCQIKITPKLDGLRVAVAT